jgi:hypothetical protein
MCVETTVKSKGLTWQIVKIVLSLGVGLLVVYPIVLYGRHFLVP